MKYRLLVIVCQKSFPSKVVEQEWTKTTTCLPFV